ncbi:MAG: ribosome biogenesis GTPase Der [Rhodospirillaceae bacterium]|nr:ribosome biogenesis GTPase Der [Rhodospirillaceae bacterium]
MTFVVAIIGRPNVGKSTLFNRLVGKRHALVDDTPGVTRDRRQGIGRVSDLEFTLFDTAGLEEENQKGLAERMRKQTEVAIGDADVVLMLIDARAGITPLDSHLCRWVRRQKNNIILIANKCEGQAATPGLLESYRLGLGEPIPISAEHGEGMADLYVALSNMRGGNSSKNEEVDEQLMGLSLTACETEPHLSREEEGGQVLRLAIVGRPNVGKSTLVNTLTGKNRVLTGPEAGITRDSIEVEWEWEGQPLLLYDTAGLRRKSRIDDRLEKASGEDTWRAIRFAHIVVLMLDSHFMLERQDLNIARMVIEEGRGLVLAANKWDIVKNKKEALTRLENRIKISLPQVRDVPFVALSALQNLNIEKLLERIFFTHGIWNRRIATSNLNRWLARVTDRHPPPLVQGRRLKLRYITQTRTRPPSFVCFCNQPQQLTDSYKRYMINGLREEFSLPGVPIRLLIRGGSNPYV